MFKIMGGVSYYPDHWPKAEWEKDLRLIKESGLDCVRFGEFSWNWFEPEEGKFDFENYDIFMDTAYKLGLKVILCTPTAAPPEWLLNKYSDIRMMDQYGRLHYQGRHMVCFNHPEFIRIAENTITELAKHYENHPALEGWQIDNEPTVGESAAIDRLYDYNPHTSELFRKYLIEKYENNLEKLNSCWHNNFWSRSYTSWVQVEPPRDPVIPSLWLEWMRFRADNVTHFVQWQLKLLKRVNRNFIVGTNVPECGPLMSTTLGQDYWKQVEGMAYIGTDVYCYAGDEYKEKKSIGYSCDMIHSVAKHYGISFWISETPGGPHLSPWRFQFFDGVWDLKFLEESALQYAIHGAERILFFLWRPVLGGREFGMNGLANMDGSPSERSKAVAGILENAGKEKLKIKNLPVAYIHYSGDSLKLATGFDPDKTADGSYHGWYNILTDCGYAIEFLNDETLSEKSWSGNELLVLPHTFVIDEKVAKAIQAAACIGTKVLAGYGIGFYNEYGCCNRVMPGFELDTTFGFKLKAVDYVDEPKQAEIEGLQGIKIGAHRGVIESEGAEIIAFSTEKKPLVLRNKSLFYFAFDLGEIYMKIGFKSDICKWFVNKIN